MQEIINASPAGSRFSFGRGWTCFCCPRHREGARMFFSPTGHIAFAHYPKTAGSSLLTWFRDAFPDAAYVEAAVYHMPVRMSLERLGLIGGFQKRNKIVRESLRLFRKILPRNQSARERCDLRIIGVVREPFEMLVSLYEYWRRCEFPEEPTSELIRAAHDQSFRVFLELAIIDQQLQNYETYFDVGGPAWATTRLLDFHSLDSALAAVCCEFGIQGAVTLQRHNAAPRRLRDIKEYAAEAGSLVFEARKYFRWYYEEARHIMVRGDRAPILRSA